MPKSGRGGADRAGSRGDAVRDFGKMNERLRDSLMTALKIEEQKRLEYVKRKPTLQPRELGTVGGLQGEWKPLIRRETPATALERRQHMAEESFNLFQGSTAAYRHK